MTLTCAENAGTRDKRDGGIENPPVWLLRIALEIGSVLIPPSPFLLRNESCGGSLNRCSPCGIGGAGKLVVPRCIVRCSLRVQPFWLRLASIRLTGAIVAWRTDDLIAFARRLAEH